MQKLPSNMKSHSYMKVTTEAAINQHFDKDHHFDALAMDPERAAQHVEQEREKFIAAFRKSDKGYIKVHQTGSRWVLLED